MVCPSCGKDVASRTRVCSCGARWVGDPSTELIYPVPRLIYGLTALFIIAGAAIVQLVITIRSLYLSQFRWPWELLLTTSYLARFVLPLGLMAAYLGWRGARLAARQPQQYGGRRLSRCCLTLALLLCLMNLGAVALRLPDAIRDGRLKRLAHTRAMMYKVNAVISKYREQYGTYPERLIDLQEMDPSIRPILDAWDHPIVYTPMSAEIASRGVPAPFQNYQLISRGADGVMGTDDDIVMRDGLIISATPDGEEGQPHPEPRRSTVERIPPRRP